MWSFKDLLTWKIPEHLISTSARDSQALLAKKQEEQGYVCSYSQFSHLYKLDLVTQRVKEQKVTFVGIVTHVKCYVSFPFDSNQIAYFRMRIVGDAKKIPFNNAQAI